MAGLGSHCEGRLEMLQSGSLMHVLGGIIDPTLSEMAVALVSKESASRNTPLQSKK